MRGVASAVIAALAIATGCNQPPAGESRRPAASGMALSPGEGGAPVSLDSALVLFREDLDSIATLESGSRSIDDLVATLARTVATADTASLRTLVMTRREFAFLYYPTSPYVRAPTKQEPALAWFLHVQHSEKGATRLLNRFGGRPLSILTNSCEGAGVKEGANTLWHDCVQHVVAGRDTVRMRLFGGILKRGGVYKILTYANDL